MFLLNLLKKKRNLKKKLLDFVSSREINLRGVNFLHMRRQTKKNYSYVKIEVRTRVKTMGKKIFYIKKNVKKTMANAKQTIFAHSFNALEFYM